MSYVINTMTNLASQTGFAFLKPGNFIMVVVALIFLYLAIVKQYEPLLLVPISFGMLLVNLYPPIMQEGGLLHYFYLLDEWSILPSDLPWGWSIDRLWTTDRQSKEFPSWSGSPVWYLCSLFSGNLLTVSR